MAANARLIADGHLEVVEQFFTSDYIAHLTDRDMQSGHDGVRKVLGMLRQAFPKIQVEVEILVEGEARVAWQRTFQGTQEGAYLGFPASGRHLVWRDLVTSEFRGGRIAEEWVITDLAEQLLRARKRRPGGPASKRR